MKITKRQLRRIIKEERHRLQEVPLLGKVTGVPGRTHVELEGPIEVRGILEDLLIPALIEEGLQGWGIVDTLRAAADLMENEWSLGER